MSILAWIEDQKRLKLLNAPKYVHPASDSSKGLWTRCDKCGVILYIKHLKENQRVCFGCSYHLQMSSQERVENLLDKSSWNPLDETVSPCDPLEFHDQKDYTDRLQEAQERTGLQDAIQTGSGLIDGIPVALGVMDFDFMGGSMGSVVGEKVTRLIEYATQEGLTLILVCASGGARMQEGVFSLMQMAKISSALQLYQSCANLLYISILTSPTTGGVTASFAMLGDIIFAEPKALVAFAGRRVIEQTLCEDLPEDFQTSEYMLHHGLLDLIVPRRFLRQALSESIRLYKNAPHKKPGRIPFGVQNPITFLVEERIRRRWGHEKNASLSPRELNVPQNLNLERAASISESSSQTGTARAPASEAGAELMLPTQSYNSADISADARANTRADDTTLRNNSQLVKGENSDIKDARKNSRQRNGSLNESNERKDLENAKSRTFSQEKDHVLGTSDSITSQAGASALPMLPAKIPVSGESALQIQSNSFDPIFQRETGEYRNILTSFETMFNLFSKRLVVPLSDDNSAAALTFLEPYSDKNSISLNERKGVLSNDQSRANHEGDFAKDSSTSKAPDSLLHSFMTLSENQAHNYQAQAEPMPETGTRADSSVRAGNLAERKKTSISVNNNDVGPLGSSRESSLDRSTEQDESLIALRSTCIDFLNQSIELAATESVEWRAFYVHQKISKRTGFLEDFLRSDCQNSLDEREAVPQNTLFYRSICRNIS